MEVQLLLNHYQINESARSLSTKKGFFFLKPASSLSCLKSKHLPKAIVYGLHTIPLRRVTHRLIVLPLAIFGKIANYDYDRGSDRMTQCICCP